MKTSWALLLGGLVASFGGAYLLGLWAVGILLVVVGVAAMVCGVLLDDGRGREPQAVHTRPPRSERESLERMFEQQQYVP